LFQTHRNIKWIGVGLVDSKSIFSYYYRLRQKLWKLFERITSGKFLWSARGFTMYSQELEKIAQKHKADLYIGHNLGALRAIVIASQKFNSISIFDFEDYYSGEHQKENFISRLIKKYESSHSMPNALNCVASDFNIISV
jgi:hypothetical protein